MTLSISRGFTSSSERGVSGGRRPTVGEGAADGKFAFATSASYTAVQPDTIGALALSYLTLHPPFFLPPFDEAFADTVALPQETRDHTGHLPSAVVALNNGLVLINDHGDALKERCQSGDVVQWGRRCSDLVIETRTYQDKKSCENVLCADAGGRTFTRSTMKDAYASNPSVSQPITGNSLKKRVVATASRALVASVN